jgi:plastocyanin
MGGYIQKRNVQNKMKWVLVFSIAISLMLAACQPAGLGNTKESPTTPATTVPAGGSQSQANNQIVNLINTAFDPKQISVPVGTTVSWVNKDSMAHTVTADDKSFDSGNLNPGDTFKFTLTKAGTFPYHCQYHGGPNGVGMSGVITVTTQ